MSQPILNSSGCRTYQVILAEDYDELEDVCYNDKPSTYESASSEVALEEYFSNWHEVHDRFDGMDLCVRHKLDTGWSRWETYSCVSEYIEHHVIRKKE